MEPVKILIMEQSGRESHGLRQSLADGAPPEWIIDWTSSSGEGLIRMKEWDPALCLINERLNQGEGIDLIRNARREGCKAAMILLTDGINPALDEQAMQAGATDALPRTTFDARTLPGRVRQILRYTQLERELNTVRENLDRCVMSRTTELHDAVLALQQEVENRKQIEDKLRAAVLRLERHNVAKTEFVANVSHELKTPLTSMIYGVRNLLKGIAGPLPDHAIRYLKLFDTECQRLIATINDILDLAKIENHTLTLAPITTPLGYLINRCLETLGAQIEAAQITLNCDIHPGVPFVRSDPNMIQRVVLNILGNSVKFTPRGGTITIIAESAYPQARITVTDTGTGIPPDAIDRVTERYFRADNRTSGSGLGLAISKEIMHLHGGSLTVTSPPAGRKNGTEVVITLPLAEPPTVLVGDDDPAILDLIKIHLGKEGYRVVTALSGQDVILMAEASKPDVILLDLILEDIHGTTVILSLRGSPQIRYIPIIAITGATLDQATADILTRFTVPTLTKPWKAAELVATVDAALMGKTAFQSGGVS